MSAEGVQDLEMPGKLEIMRAVQKGLDSLTVALHVDEVGGDKVWTQAVKTKLCEIGHGFGYEVCASGMDSKADYGEWLYDVTWLEYERDLGKRGLDLTVQARAAAAERKRRLLIDSHLVAECEWGNLKDIIDDFEKLLLARAGVCLMIFEGISKRIPEPRSKRAAEQLAGRIREFKGSCAEDDWLLAAWERNDDEEKGWSFRYFTIDRNAAIPFPPPN